MKCICVFCGSGAGNRPEYVASARGLAALLQSRGWGLVYGGGRVGMMGALADAALAAGVQTVGVIPQALVEREVAHTGLTELRVVSSMHDRKALMADLADGFVALPGGLGTLDEFFEICTWAQLGIHAKPCGLVNVAGYFDPLLAVLDRAVEEGFLNETHRSIVMVESSAEALLMRFDRFRPKRISKYADRWDR